MKFGKIHLSKKELWLIVALEALLVVLLLSVGLMMTAPLRVRLAGDAEMTLFCGEAFTDPGAAATVGDKAVDVTVSGVVDTQTPGTYILSYTAQYQMTSQTVTRTVHVQREEPASIQLLGEPEVIVTVGTGFQEPGYRATDCIGRDVTAQVQVSGSVDTSKCGTYELCYAVTDGARDVTVVRRTVKVEPVKQPDVVDPDGKVIYLTFDDGPGPYTRQLLEVLAKYNAKATFFVVDNDLDHLMKKIVDKGHAIGIHSTSHRYEEIYSSPEAFFQDIYKMQDIIKRNTGVETTLLRFPGGSSNEISRNYYPGIMSILTEAVQDAGFQYFDWNVLSGDAGDTTSTQKIAENVINGVAGNSYAIVLQHDIHRYSVEAVEDILLWGQNNGYVFEALTPNSPGCHQKVMN